MPGHAWCLNLGELLIPLSLSFFIRKVGVVKGVVRSQKEYWECSANEGH